MALPKELLEILACPVCKNDVREKGNFLICVKCRKAYRVRGGIPIMLAE